MLANFLDKTKPIIFVLLVGFFFLFFFANIYLENRTPELNFDVISIVLKNVIIFATIFFLFNFIVGKNELTYDNGYAFFLFILFAICSIEDYLNSSIALNLFVQLLFVRKLYSLQSSKNRIKKIFDAGFWLAILCLLEPIFIGYAVLLYIGVFVHQKITFNTAITPILGFLAPVIIVFAYYVWIGSPEWEGHLNFSRYSWGYEEYLDGKIRYFVALVLLLTLTALILKPPFKLAFKNTFEKNWLVLTLHLITAFILLLFLPQKSSTELLYVLFPVSVIVANGVELIHDKSYRNVFISINLVFFLTYIFVL